MQTLALICCLVVKWLLLLIQRVLLNLVVLMVALVHARRMARIVVHTVELLDAAHVAGKAHGPRTVPATNARVDAIAAEAEGKQ